MRQSDQCHGPTPTVALLDPSLRCRQCSAREDAVTERCGRIGDDLVEREAKRLVEFRAQGGVR